jgi:cell filamentation protein
MSKYQLKNSHIYVDGTDIPKNKLDITDSQLIHQIENDLLTEAYSTFSKAITSQTILNENYFIGLHKKTFESLYSFAGEYRTVNMSKGNSQFCLAQYLHNESKRIFTKLEQDAYLSNYKEDKELFVSKLAYYKCELIALHPFYELNGRTLRFFIDMLCIYNGYLPIDYSQAITSGTYIDASIECVQYADQSKMEKILNKGLNQRI